MQPVIFERPTENIGNEEIPFGCRSGASSLACVVRASFE
jgi:hypothetical protein